MIYVDTLDEFGNCRMAADKTVEILHTAAQILKLKPYRFTSGENVDYYQLNEGERNLAIKSGAIPVNIKYLNEKCGKHRERFQVLDEEIFQAFE